MLALRLRRAGRLCHSRPARLFSSNNAVFQVGNDATKASSSTESISSCPANTVLEGVAYLKDQPPILALPDDEYPPWLWELLNSRELPDDGPGGKAEKVRLRKENKQRIKDQNFMKTQ